MRAAKDPYCAEQVNTQWQVIAAWSMHADGKQAAALTAMRAAADAENKTEVQDRDGCGACNRRHLQLWRVAA